MFPVAEREEAFEEAAVRLDRGKPWYDSSFYCFHIKGTGALSFLFFQSSPWKNHSRKGMLTIRSAGRGASETGSELDRVQSWTGRVEHGAGPVFT